MADADALLVALCAGVVVLFIIVGFFAARRSQRRFQAHEALRRRLQATPDGLLYFAGHFGAVNFDLQTVGAPTRRGTAVLAVTTAGLTLYERGEDTPPIVHFPAAALRWFGRPKKYNTGLNEIWLHAEQNGTWQTLRLRLYADAMRQFVRALKQIAGPELVTAYRRRRPYAHFGPLTVQPADQDIHGAWTLADPLTLYLSPRHLAVLDGSHLLRAIALDHVQAITVVPRIDLPAADKLIRFSVDAEDLAFAASQADAFAAALAEAARRTLEAPPMQKQKGKEDDDWDYDDEGDIALVEQDF